MMFLFINILFFPYVYVGMVGKNWLLLVESEGSSDEDDDEDTRDLEGRTTTSEGTEVKFYIFYYSDHFAFLTN